MSKTKQDKKRKNKVVAYSNKVKARQRKMKEEFLKTLQETQSKELASKVQENVNAVSDSTDFSEFDGFNTNQNVETPNLSEFSLEESK